MMTDNELNEYISRKTECTINTALIKGIPLTFSANRRAVYKGVGKFLVWDYRINARKEIQSLFALDTILIGRKTIDGCHASDLAKALCEVPLMGYSLELGFIGGTFSNCLDKSVRSKILFNAGFTLRRKFGNAFR